ncbi:hypothetical protein J31TS4_34270 [Paenibacillus sp. J31TS4]|uniref:cold-shock protein n=1 Tax=Paenibacillus sp. J31TS4 TaxID=2807195 RepID=UPI001B194A72|nr:cold-shock protein [Paenibacillus sp. J31TS4]GIP40147.1 hypothetical protein J31TS4_34270 [Paenibacillus sp. J31TS4]
MMFSRKRTEEELQEVETAIWSCSNDTCKGWMRADFAFEDTPTCHICQSSMAPGTRMLPPLDNTSSTSRPKRKDVNA